MAKSQQKTLNCRAFPKLYVTILLEISSLISFSNVWVNCLRELYKKKRLCVIKMATEILKKKNFKTN